MTAWEFVLSVFADPLAAEPYQEDITITEHMLQTAAAAEADGTQPSLVIAALLHDIGHCIPHPDLDEHGNRYHARLGAEVLAPYFSDAMTELVRLHVPAKRYLVATDPNYVAELSPASVFTLELQGGPFTVEERQRFEAEPFHLDALAVRRWDEAGKVVDREVPRLEHYQHLVAEVAR
jgi:predicted HD phosphohydrolase